MWLVSRRRRFLYSSACESRQSDTSIAGGQLPIARTHTHTHTETRKNLSPEIMTDHVTSVVRRLYIAYIDKIDSLALRQRFAARVNRALGGTKACAGVNYSALNPSRRYAGSVAMPRYKISTNTTECCLCCRHVVSIYFLLLYAQRIDKLRSCVFFQGQSLNVGSNKLNFTKCHFN